MEDLQYLKILYTLAWADNEIQAEEFDFLDQIRKELGIDEGLEVINWRTNRLTINDIKDIPFKEWDIEQKKHVLLLAYTIAEIDGIYTNEEKSFIEELSELLELKDVNQKDLLKEIEESNELYF